MLCIIWHRLQNLKSVKNNHRGVLLLYNLRDVWRFYLQSWIQTNWEDRVICSRVVTWHNVFFWLNKTSQAGHAISKFVLFHNFSNHNKLLQWIYEYCQSNHAVESRNCLGHELCAHNSLLYSVRERCRSWCFIKELQVVIPRIDFWKPLWCCVCRKHSKNKAKSIDCFFNANRCFKCTVHEIRARGDTWLLWNLANKISWWSFSAKVSALLNPL